MAGNSGEILIKFFWSIGKKAAGYVTGVEVSDGVDFALSPAMMTGNEGKSADRLIKINEALDEDLEHLSLLQDAIRLAGFDAAAVMKDLKERKMASHEFSLNDFYKTADEFKALGALPRAIKEGAGMGYGEDAVRFMHQGSESIRSLLADAKEKGYGQSEQELKALQKAFQLGEKLELGMGRFRSNLSRGLAVPVSDAFALINGAIAENEEKLSSWAETIGNVAGGVVRFFEGFTGVIPEPDADAEARLNSDDPKIRDKEINDRRNAKLLRDLGDAVRFGRESAWDAIMGTTVDPRRLFRFYGRIDDLITDIGDAGKPIDDAERASLSGLNNPNHMKGLQHPLWGEINAAEVEGSHDYLNPEKYRPGAMPSASTGNAKNRTPPAYYKAPENPDFGTIQSWEIYRSFDNSSVEMLRDIIRPYIQVNQGDGGNRSNTPEPIAPNPTIHMNFYGQADSTMVGEAVIKAIANAYVPGRAQPVIV